MIKEVRTIFAIILLRLGDSAAIVYAIFREPLTVDATLFTVSIPQAPGFVTQKVAFFEILFRAMRTPNFPIAAQAGKRYHLRVYCPGEAGSLPPQPRSVFT
jgi:hypothetical protein